MRLNSFHDPLNVNKGVMQGGITSPWLFNIYIDDLVERLSKTAFEVLAYADDLAIICKSDIELRNFMILLKWWSKNFNIDINKKKSAILLLNRPLSKNKPPRKSKANKKKTDTKQDKPDKSNNKFAEGKDYKIIIENNNFAHSIPNFINSDTTTQAR